MLCPDISLLSDSLERGRIGELQDVEWRRCIP
jgi:hypothetical protein